jgi:hypothetical protein
MYVRYLCEKYSRAFTRISGSSLSKIFPYSELVEILLP